MTIKNPPPAVEGVTSDNSSVGKIYDVPPNVAIPMIAVGWVRNESRSRIRRQQEAALEFNRRHTSDRRSADS